MAMEAPQAVRDPVYYLAEKSLIQPRFEGKAAKLLGIQGQWDERAFLNLFKGYTTGHDGEPDKRLPKYMHSNRKGAVDITFNLPKEPSVLSLVGGDTRIDHVLTSGRERAMQEIERQYQCRSPWSKPGNLVYVAFRHAANRDGGAHLHDHVILMNLSRAPGKKGESWKAIELKYLDYKKIGDAYRDGCIKGFRQLGYKVARDKESYRIVGFPAEVKAAFSQGSARVQATKDSYESKGGLSKQGRKKVQLFDRPEKPPDKPLPERRKGWLSQLNDDHVAGLRKMVKAAREAVRRERWRGQLRKYVHNMHKLATQEQTIEREQSRAR